MSDDLCLTKAQHDILSGLGFSVIFCGFVFVVGWAVDRFRHLVLEMLVGAEVIMCLISALQAASRSYYSILLARFSLGACLSFATPCTVAIISEILSKDKRSIGNSLYSLGDYLGFALASLSVLSTKTIGWRSTVLLVSVIGITATFSFGVSVQNPEMPHVPAAVHLSWKEVKRRIAKLLANHLYSLLLMAASLRSMGTSILLHSMIIYLSNKFNAQITPNFTFFNAVAVSVAGILSCYFGGYIGSLYFKTDPSALAMIPAVGCLAALFPICGVLFTDRFFVSCFWLWFVYLFGECWKGPTLAIIQNFLPNDTVGTATALYMFSVIMCGCTAVDFVGSFSGTVQQHRTTLFVSLTVTYTLSGLLYLYVAKTIHMQTTPSHLTRENDELQALIPEKTISQTLYGGNSNAQDNALHSQINGKSPTVAL